MGTLLHPSYFEPGDVPVEKHMTECPDPAQPEPLPTMNLLPTTQTQSQAKATDSPALEGFTVAFPTIHENFEAQAALRPGAVALKFGTESITYSELNNRANQLAALLQRQGIRPETPVALYLERSIEMVVSIIAVLKAGGAYVPIDLAYPAERMAFMLEDTRAPVILTQSRLRSAVPEGPHRILCVDETVPGELFIQNPVSGATANNAAYIIYTSGSTGKPKGVIVTHHNVVRLLKSTEHWYHFSSKDIWPLFHSYSFDMSVWELWGSLFYGGKLVIVPHATARSPHDFYKLLSREKVTFLNHTPSAFRQLIRADATAEQKLPLCLRFVTLGGEALELQSLRDWFESRGDQAPVIVNKYGITETCVHTTYRPITKEDLSAGLGSVIGVPIPDLQVYLLDDKLNPVPAGEPGEICVGGDGVARGYLNRPDLNALRFVPDPFSSKPGATMYRSGDLAKINEQGEMEYLGRMDHQVKIRGFRVELGEIESALNSHSNIRESVVIAQGEDEEKRLVAYFVPRGTAPGTSELRSWLARNLPDYMVPAAFVSLPAFPLTNNGKIDRRALPKPGPSRPALSTPYTAPQTEAEKTLALVWSEVLKCDQVGRNDSFFELGGDSISGIVAISKARDRGIPITLEQLFQTPTIAALASVAAASNAVAAREIAPFDLIGPEDAARLPEDVEDAYPIAALQLGMFFHNELDPLSAMYHDVFSYSVEARFDEERLGACLTAAAKRHPILRTSFHLADYSKPLQLVHSQPVMPFSWEDLRPLTAEQQRDQALIWIEAEKRRPFDRSTAPLMRFHAQVQGDNRFQLFISFHHSCTDGWSLAALITEILKDYASALQNTNATIQSPGTSYRDFVALESAAIKSRESASFWEKLLAEASPQLLPRWPKSYCAHAHEQSRGPEIQIESNILSGLKRLAQTAGVPLKSVLLAAHQRVLATLHGDTDVTTGLVSNGRPEQGDADHLIGLFLNTLPFRQKIASTTWVELVGQTFEIERSILPHRRYPLAEIQKLVGHSVVETAFDFVHFHVLNEIQPSSGLAFAEGPYFEANNLTTYTTFMLSPNSTRLELHIDYDPNQISRDQIIQIDDFYLDTLREMAANPKGNCLQFSPMREERFRLLREWNDTAREYPPEQTIHAIFEKRAAETPHAIAVTCGSEKLTYAELNRRADALAAILAAKGPMHERLVGICLDRSCRMLVALLGILKAGAAYVPLDPAFPRERLSYMIADAALSIIITEDRVLDALPDGSAERISMDHLPAEIPRMPAPATGSGNGRNHSNDLAYVIYTSGSTGKPKGVQIEHRSVINLLFSAAEKLNLKPSDNLLAVTTLSFDIAALELLMPLTHGASVTIADRDTVSDGPALAALIATSKATLMQATPSTWRLLLDSGWTGQRHLTVICGGESLSPALARQLLQKCGALWNFYGPTETTIWSTAWKVDATEPISIGRPLANTQAYILNSAMEPLPIGAIGELWLGGDGVARGYLNQPALTCERFVPHPFAARSGMRLYKTGDLARFLPDGRIECLGRADHQVKVRGFRIELGEIETALRQHDGIADAVVTARPDRNGDNRLTAYIVCRDGDPGIKQLREYLAAQLPHYMVPSHFVVMPRLPLTPNGKIDLKQLPSPEQTAATAGAFVKPEGNLEESLATIWRDILEVPQVGAEDNLFDLGADSLTATRAFARINTTLGTGIGLRDIFEHPTVRSQAQVAQNVPRTSSGGIKPQPRLRKVLT